jgi:hypothetical protein
MNFFQGISNEPTFASGHVHKVRVATKVLVGILFAMIAAGVCVLAGSLTTSPFIITAAIGAWYFLVRDERAMPMPEWLKPRSCNSVNVPCEPEHGFDQFGYDVFGRDAWGSYWWDTTDDMSPWQRQHWCEAHGSLADDFIDAQHIPVDS